MSRTFQSLAAIAMSASMRGAQIGLPDNRPVVPPPAHVREMPHRSRAEKRLERARVVAERKAKQAARHNRRGFLARLTKRPPPNNGYQARVNKLTNWQRNQWARDGYRPDRLEYYIAKTRSE
jgi:acetyl-CoA carboxylase alpha subunit